MQHAINQTENRHGGLGEDTGKAHLLDNASRRICDGRQIDTYSGTWRGFNDTPQRDEYTCTRCMNRYDKSNY